MRTAGPRPGSQPYLNELVSAVYAPSVSLSGPDGQMRSPGAEGLYVQDLRALSGMVMTLDGAEPAPIGYDLVGGTINEFYLAVAASPGPGYDPQVLVSRRRALSPDGMTETFTVTSYAPAGLDFRLELELACDLASMGAVKAGRPPPGLPARATGHGLAWELPGRCSVVASGSPGPATTDPASGVMAWDIQVQPSRPATVAVQVGLHEDGPAPPFVAARHAAPALGPEVVADDHRLRRLIRLSLADLGGLRLAAAAQPDDTFVAAGAPWYLTLFGRDSIWAARMLLPLGTDLALGTLRALARRQGRSSDGVTGEQPGRILHEVRRPPRDEGTPAGPSQRRRPSATSGLSPPDLLRDGRCHAAVGLPAL